MTPETLTALAGFMGIILGGGGVFGLIKYQTKVYTGIVEKALDIQSNDMKTLANGIGDLNKALAEGLRNQAKYTEMTTINFQRIFDYIGRTEKK